MGATSHSSSQRSTAHHLARLGQRLRAVALEHALLLGLVALFVAVVTAAHLLLAPRGFLHLRWTFRFLNLFGIGFAVCFLTAQLLRRLPRMRRDELSLAGALREVRQGYLSVEALGGLLLAFLPLAPFFSAFTSVKQAIPRVQPFAWDHAFADLDAVVHLGHDPWRLLQPLLGHPSITAALDLLYMLWFPLLFGLVLWMAWSQRRRLRAQFFLCCALLWIVLGSGAALLFASAGPCYFHLVPQGSDRFRPLMRYLARVNQGRLWAVHNQRSLWQAQQRGQWLTFGGISAMPSMHVSAAVLYAITGWRTHPLAGTLLTAYAMLTQLGSVHLGWHYAIDGYVGTLATLGLWRLAGLLLTLTRWRPATDAPPAAAPATGGGATDH